MVQVDSIRPVQWQEGALVLLDQRALPIEERFVVCERLQDAAEAIASMTVRGAPAIGCAAAFGLLLAAHETGYRDDPHGVLDQAAARLEATRPTAVNLAWALARMLRAAEGITDPDEIMARLTSEAQAILDEDLAACKAMGAHGLELVGQGARIMTHCNAGALATAGYGTALGVIRAAWEAGRLDRVYACETRPRQQGARLTAWELHRDGIPVTLLSDTATGYAMKQGLVDLIVVGADRIAANGDVANKIGTYNLALLARHHGIPLYVAAPISTLDMETARGQDIVIEHRCPEEVTHCGGCRVAPEGIDVFNPAFDVTDAELVAAIVTDRGLARPPYDESLARLVSS